MSKATLHLRTAIRRLALIVAASAALLAAIGAGSPAFAQPPHRQGGGWGRGGAPGWNPAVARPAWNPGAARPGWSPNAGRPPWNPGAARPAWNPAAARPAWNRGAAPAWNRAPAPVWGRGGPSPGPNWDQRRYNGYFVGGRWYYGAPQAPAFVTPGFRPGFTPWRRGSFLPPAYQGFVVNAYWQQHLRRPPYGYHWVQVGGEFLLVSASTGLIFDVVNGQ